MIKYEKLNQTQSDIYFNGGLIGHIDLIGDMYAIEVHYTHINLPREDKRLVRGLIERLNKQHINYQYKQYVKIYNLRNSIMFGRKYVEFNILD